MKKKQESQEADGESMTITIENEASKELPFDYKALIERVVMGCMDYEKCPYEAEVNVLLTNNEEIHTPVAQSWRVWCPPAVRCCRPATPAPHI